MTASSLDRVTPSENIPGDCNSSSSQNTLEKLFQGKRVKNDNNEDEDEDGKENVKPRFLIDPVKKEVPNAAELEQRHQVCTVIKLEPIAPYSKISQISYHSKILTTPTSLASVTNPTNITVDLNYTLFARFVRLVRFARLVRFVRILLWYKYDI